MPKLYRNKNLVFTSVDMPKSPQRDKPTIQPDTTLDKPSRPERSKKSPRLSIEKPIQKRSIVRRSSRLAAKTAMVPQYVLDSESSSDSSTDSDLDLDTDTDTDTDAIDGTSSCSDSDSEVDLKDLVKGVFLKRMIDTSTESDDEEFQDVVEMLQDDLWFRKLSNQDQILYVGKLQALMAPSIEIPSIKDIIDLDINPDNKKELLQLRWEIDTYDKLNTDFDLACYKLVNRMNYLSANNDEQLKLQQVEKSLMATGRATEPVRNRILTSDFSDSIKNIIYEKYVAMSETDDDTAGKYRIWIETALMLPLRPKLLTIDASMPLNQQLNSLMGRMMTELNRKIYGMASAKEELLCIIANMITNPRSKNKAIGLYGPPGIGKTMIADILANTLGLPLAKIAMGGVADSSFLEGHGFTYIGAEAGCITKSIIKMGHTNGIIFLDELDKISKTEHGKEIEHALLHITDFTQNHEFRDKYLQEIPLDLSDYIFIYSMNSLADVDSALVSRIPVIRFDGYTRKEKVLIARDYIIPELLANYSLDPSEIIIGDDRIAYIINRVTESDESEGKSGVRGLKNILNRIISRINLYKLASINGKLGFDLSFRIDGFSLPYVLDENLIDAVLTSKINDKNEFMYL